MANSAMLVCSFFLKKKFCHEDSGIYNLNQEIGTDNGEKKEDFADFFELLSFFCDNHATFSDDERLRKMFAVKNDTVLSHETDTYRAVSFVVQSGSYGVEADMTNRKTLAVSYHRTEDEADVKLFRCVVYVPKDVGEIAVNKGIFVFQSIASYGVKTITVDMMKRFFSQLGLTLETRSVSVQVFLQKLIDQGALNKITLIRNSISPNIADNIFIATGREEKSYVKPQLRPEWLSKILGLFAQADETDVVEIPDDEDFDDLAIQFKLGKNTRTVRLKNLDRLSIVEDIPDNVMTNRNDSVLIDHMINTADAYRQKIVFEISNEESS